MQTVQEIKDLADLRLEEAALLHNNGLHDGAIYLAGYAVELILKAKICESLEISNFFHEDSEVDRRILRSFKTHDLEALLTLSGLSSKFQIAKRNNDDLSENWNTICEWSENYRYCVRGVCEPRQASNFLNAIIDNQNGFKTWIDNI